jgi:hypothetical protein
MGKVGMLLYFRKPLSRSSQFLPLREKENASFLHPRAHPLLRSAKKAYPVGWVSASRTVTSEPNLVLTSGKK